MRSFYSLFVMVFLSSCGYDMAAYTKFSTPPCQAEKVATMSPNIYGIDGKIYEATSEWVKKTLTKQGYLFDATREANVLVTINHEVLDKKEPGVEAGEEKDARQGALSTEPIYYHQLVIILEDIGCKKESMTLTVNLETYSPQFNDIIPELLESLEDPFTRTKGPHSKTVKRIQRKI